MFDEDDGVDPQFEDVNEYYFEDGEEKPICFNILPFQFGENSEVADYDIENVYLRGFADKSLHIYRKVVGWSLRLDLEQPNIYVLSSEQKWIRLLKPRKCYEKFVRSILITVQMIHFVRKRDKRSCWRHLWDHLHEVFDKYDTEPVLDDLIKHQPLIKLFVDRDQTLMESKIIQRFIKNNFKKINKPILKTMGTKAQVFISDERCASKNDDDNDYNEVDSDDDSSGDDTNDDDGTDQICAICDDGGDLLSCEGSCKRSFHPTMEDGRESKCETLGYTSAQVKRIDIYLCENCKYKQHQCFKCGELGPSDGPNAKVFQCNNASCGHFYHPKCIAQLLEPDATDGACELERRILAGMSFTCPIHWCFKCERMEDKTQRALKLAVCRRCPMAYHRDCLPREFSLNTKDNNVNKRAWKLSRTLLIYCLNHKIDKATGTARRNHIKFPAIAEGSKSRDLGKNEDRMTGKRRNNTDQCSTKSTETNRLFIEESKKTHSVAVNNSSPRIVLESQCAAKCLKEDLQFGPSMVGTAVVDSLSEHMVLNPVRAARCLKEDLQFEPSVVGADSSLSGLEAVKGQEKQFGTSPFVTGTRVRMSSSCVVGRQEEDRVTSKDNKETNSGRSHDIARKRVMPSTKGIYGPSVQDILPGNSLVDKNAEWDRTKGDKYVSERDKTSEHYSGEESGAPNKDTSHENHEQNAVLDNLFVEKHAEEDGSKLKSGKEMGMERGENAYGHNSISGQTEEISRRENRIGKSTCEQDSRSEKRKIARNYSRSGSGNGVVTLDHIDDHPTEKQLHVVRVDKATIANRTDTQSEYGCGEDREVNESYACQEKQNSSQCNDNPKVIEIDTVGEKLRKRTEHKEKATGINKAELDNDRKYNQIDGKEARYEDNVLDCRLKSSGHDGPQGNDENAAAETSKYKSRERTGSNRREETMHNIRANSSNSPVRRNAQKRSRNYSPEGQRMDNRDSYHGTNNRRTYEQQRHVNFSSNDYVDRRPWSPRESAVSPDFGTGRWHSPPYLSREEHGIARRFSPRGPEYVSSRRHSSPFRPRTLEVNHTMDWNNSHNLEYDQYRSSRSCASPPCPRRPDYGKSKRHSLPFPPRNPDLPPFPRIPEYGTNRRHCPLRCPSRSEYVDYTMDWNSSPNIYYDRYDHYEYCGYEAMDIDPVASYSSRGRFLGFLDRSH